MVRVWVSGKTVWFPCYTWAISERFRDKELTYKALYKFAFFTFIAAIVSNEPIQNVELSLLAAELHISDRHSLSVYMTVPCRRGSEWQLFCVQLSYYCLCRYTVWVGGVCQQVSTAWGWQAAAGNVSAVFEDFLMKTLGSINNLDEHETLSVSCACSYRYCCKLLTAGLYLFNFCSPPVDSVQTTVVDQDIRGIFIRHKAVTMRYFCTVISTHMSAVPLYQLV